MSLGKSEIPIVKYTELDQQGNCFGERIANGFEYAFSLGYENIIAVGNDSPGLCLSNWEEINRDLNEGKAIIGPSASGGAWLIGLSKSQFNKSDFQSLSWQSNLTFVSLLAYCAKHSLQVKSLEMRQDLNKLSDIQLYANSGLIEEFRLFLYNLLHHFDKKKSIEQKIKLSDKHSSSSGMRAPPVV